MGFLDNLKHGWDAFRGREPTVKQYYGPSSSYHPGRVRMTRGNERSIVTTILNRIAVDVASINVTHADLDQNGRYSTTRDSGLNYCLTVSSNIDQTARMFMQDAVISMLNDGVIAIVPETATANPQLTASYDITSWRVGTITRWFPEFVTVNMYNHMTGVREDITLPKRSVAIVPNPFYQIMNEPNSTFQRLVRKLAMLDDVDKNTASGKLDLIIQLPYTIKTQAKREEAEKRRKDIEMQLSGSTYGVAYADSTEKIVQLNRAVENNLLSQIQYLTQQVYNQLGMAMSVFDGTADETVMLNYNNRVVEPILSAIVDEMNRKFLSKTARSQGQKIVFFRDPFRLVPINQMADIADKFTRNEILSSNEVRQIVGFKPSDDPAADELRNKNLNQQVQEPGGEPQSSYTDEDGIEYFE